MAYLVLRLPSLPQDRPRVRVTRVRGPEDIRVDAIRSRYILSLLCQRVENLSFGMVMNHERVPLYNVQCTLYNVAVHVQCTCTAIFINNGMDGDESKIE